MEKNEKKIEENLKRTRGRPVEESKKKHAKIDESPDVARLRRAKNKERVEESNFLSLFQGNSQDPAIAGAGQQGWVMEPCKNHVNKSCKTRLYFPRVGPDQNLVFRFPAPSKT